MILKKPDSFELTFTEEEKGKLKDAADLVSDLIEKLQDNNLNYIRTGYDDCYTGYITKDLIGVYQALSDLAKTYLAERIER